MLNRREILKRFGVGATIVPIIGATVDTKAVARIIEPPRVEMVDLPRIELANDMPGGPFDIRDAESALLVIRDRRGSTRAVKITSIEADGIISGAMSVQISFLDERSPSSERASLFGECLV